MNPEVNLLGFDLYNLGYVDDIINISEQRTFKKDKLFVNEYKLKVKNFDNFFSIDNNVSLFKNNNWLFTPIIIKNESGEIIWDGIVTDIQADHEKKIANVVSKNVLAQYFKYKIEYTSSDWETGAEAFKNICDNIGFTNYNAKSVQDSINLLDYNSCYLKCRFDIEQGITFQQAIEKIAEYSGADCFVNKNDIYFKVWKQYVGGAIGSITENDLISLPKITHLSKEIINQYNIGYDNDGGTPATDDNSNDIGLISRNNFGTFELPEMNGTNSQIIFKDKTSATFVGELYIRRTHKNLLTYPMPLREIDFDLKYDFKYYLDINTYIKLPLSDESWNNKVFEITETVIDSNKNKISITALEVDE